MSTLNKNIHQAIQDFDGIQQAIIDKGVDVPSDTPTSEYGEKIREIKTGITPSGTIDISENGEYDVATYEFANVEVPQPSGKINITENGTYDVAQYATADVNVPRPSGTIDITENGHHNVADYSDAVVNVPITEIQKNYVENYYYEYEPIVPSFSDLIIYSESGVSKIGGSACFGNSVVKNVYFSNSITEIMSGHMLGGTPGVFSTVKGAFAFCKNLENVYVGQGGNLTSIGSYAFTGCENLTHCKFLNFTDIGSYAFSATKISDSISTNNLRKIWGNAFTFAQYVSEIKITGIMSGTNDAEISSWAFQYCPNIHKIILNASNNNDRHLNISANAFSDNTLTINTFAVLSNNVIFNSDTFYNTNLTIENFYTHLNQSDFATWVNNLSDTVLKAAIQNATIIYEYAGDGSEL